MTAADSVATVLACFSVIVTGVALIFVTRLWRKAREDVGFADEITDRIAAVGERQRFLGLVVIAITDVIMSTILVVAVIIAEEQGTVNADGLRLGVGVLLTAQAFGFAFVVLADHRARQQIEDS